VSPSASSVSAFIQRQWPVSNSGLLSASGCTNNSNNNKNIPAAGGKSMPLLRSSASLATDTGAVSMIRSTTSSPFPRGWLTSQIDTTANVQRDKSRRQLGEYPRRIETLRSACAAGQEENRCRPYLSVSFVCNSGDLNLFPAHFRCQSVGGFFFFFNFKFGKFNLLLVSNFVASSGAPVGH